MHFDSILCWLCVCCVYAPAFHRDGFILNYSKTVRYRRFCRFHFRFCCYSVVYNLFLCFRFFLRACIHFFKHSAWRKRISFSLSSWIWNKRLQNYLCIITVGLERINRSFLKMGKNHNVACLINWRSFQMHFFCRITSCVTRCVRWNALQTKLPVSIVWLFVPSVHNVFVFWSRV